ncbi:molybdopterin-dependent oxidoreductase [Sphingomonas sp. BIUV-7]|uniref:Molybdopterin-dependent oxidoreductase n=1 Tax=Sphingomonas natans TaxID=3063330 RepID=A0ABT8YFX3_9SPHN|nr:molybdopterin-dependent oxidoreductase [Sphingomonas sp. BIUV-7]MDO6416744.1 molybdopterin-dependent oxidoreductase [Sphingomonas sp. BIUV-7]
MSGPLTRRGLIALGGGALLAGCDKIGASSAAKSTFKAAEKLTMGAQRLVTDRAALAPEFGAGDISPVFRSNGNATPGTPDYARLLAGDFRDWRLEVSGLVDRPQLLSLAEIEAMPRRTQTTRHDCVEGWSAIGRWTGVPLRLVLARAGVRPSARYIVFHCFDSFAGAPYYESVDMIDALHPQTILAFGLNGHRLPVPNGAPLRLRVERQLGYKHAKFLRGVEAVASLDSIGRGGGGTWEDVGDYAWYAGI